ncbi:hypothetical protein F383_30338 [Gossypium arboreum]|uniref:Uncharacterized protein n=1 Tax=Gossypium arboreum TaxID=29729 RepID=A0A0B0PH34_GOSAR|nr:hypothetical protein F383_30338 [Gossypium arboreum]
MGDLFGCPHVAHLQFYISFNFFLFFLISHRLTN